MSRWCARSDGVPWTSSSKRRIFSPAATGSCWSASHDVMPSSSVARIRKAASVGVTAGSANPDRTAAIAASGWSRTSDSLVGK